MKSKFVTGEISSYEKSVIRMRTDDRYKDVVEKEFLDEDWYTAAERYCRSNAFGTLKMLLESMALPARARILEFGGGRGLLSNAIAAAGYKAFLSEISRSVVTGLGGIPDGVSSFEATCSDALNLPFADNRFDVVICKQVLHHLEHLEATLAEVYRVTSHGGYFIALKEHCLPWYGGLKTFLNGHPGAQLGAQENAYRTSTYIRAMHNAGFGSLKILEIQSFEDIRETYRAGGWKRIMTGLPVVGRAIENLAYRKYALWKKYFLTPGQTMSFVARKRSDPGP